MVAITLKRYKISRAGGGGLRSTIPKLVMNAWDLKSGDTKQIIFRDVEELIIPKPTDAG